MDPRLEKMLGLKLFVVLSKGSGADIAPVLPEHLDYLIGLEKEGKVFASGPLGAPGSGDGMTILRAASQQEAEEIAARDPFVQKAGRTFTVQPWIVNEGRFTVTVDLSDRSLGGI